MVKKINFFKDVKKGKKKDFDTDDVLKLAGGALLLGVGIQALKVISDA